jgi:hypothetical protein
MGSDLKFNMPIIKLYLLSLALVLALAPWLSGIAVGSGERITLNLPDGQDPGALYLRPGGPHARLTATLDFEAFDASGAGDHLFVAAGDDGLVVLAAREQETPQRIAQLALDGPVTTIRITGDIAWLIGPLGLTSVDISTPGVPAILMHYPLPSTPIDFVTGDGMAWLLLARELLTFDLSVPGHPILVGRSGLGFNARALAVHQNRVFLAAGAAGLVTFDRRQPPPRAPGIRPGGAVNDIALADERLHVATDDGITIVESAGADGLRWLGSFRTERPVLRIAVADGLATVQTADHRLWLLDVANPGAIRIIALLARDCCTAWQHHGRHAFVLSGATLAVVDVSVPAPQSGNEGLDFGQGVNLGGQRRVHIDGDIAYVADWFAGLHLYAIDDPARPRLLASLNTDGSAKGVVVRNGVAFVADDDHGLQVIDVSDPQRPHHVANLLLPGLAYTPVLDGDRLWLASHYGGLLVIDVADPHMPALIAHYGIPGRTWSLRVSNGIAYVAADDAGLLLLDVTDPQAPRMLGSYAPGGRAEEVIIDGDRAYIAFFDDGVHIVDVGDPILPRRLGQVTTPGNARGLDLRGDLLYVADWRAGVHILDVSEPTRPRILGNYDTDGAAWGLQVSGDIAFVADWWGGITLLDVGSAQRPLPVGHYPPRTPIEAIATAGNFAFLAQGDAGVQVFDIDNPLNPTWVTGLELPGAHDIVIDGNRAFVLVGDGRIAVIDISDPYQPHLLRMVTAGHEARALRDTGGHLLLVEAAGVALVDPDDGATRRFTTGSQVNDAWHRRQRLYVATDAGLHVLDMQGTALPGSPMLAAKRVSLIRGDGDLVLVHVPGEGIRVLSATPGQREFARISLAHQVMDMRIDGTMLHVATDAPGILTFDVADWRLVSAHETIGPISGLTAHQGTLYLAGASQLLAITPPPPVRIETVAADRITLHLPHDLPPGDYDLAAAVAPLPGPVLRRSAVTVEPLRFGRPQISADEFEALRRQHLRQAQ